MLETKTITKKHKGLKGVVYRLMEEKGQALDQDVYNEADKIGLDISTFKFSTVNIYVQSYRKLFQNQEERKDGVNVDRV